MRVLVCVEVVTSLFRACVRKNTPMNTHKNPWIPILKKGSKKHRVGWISISQLSPIFPPILEFSQTNTTWHPAGVRCAPPTTPHISPTMHQGLHSCGAVGCDDGLSIHVVTTLLSKRDLTNPVYVCILGMMTVARIKRYIIDTTYGSVH